jgi:hypothetical protein
MAISTLASLLTESFHRVRDQHREERREKKKRGEEERREGRREEKRREKKKRRERAEGEEKRRDEKRRKKRRKKLIGVFAVREPKTVLVIGAGFAGLTAAFHLQSLGYSVTVRAQKKKESKKGEKHNCKVNVTLLFSSLGSRGTRSSRWSRR